MEQKTKKIDIKIIIICIIVIIAVVEGIVIIISNNKENKETTKQENLTSKTIEQELKEYIKTVPKSDFEKLVKEFSNNSNEIINNKILSNIAEIYLKNEIKDYKKLGTIRKKNIQENENEIILYFTADGEDLYDIGHFGNQFKIEFAKDTNILKIQRHNIDYIVSLTSENQQENKEISYKELISNIQEVEKIEITKSNNTAKVKYKKEDSEKIVVIPSIDAMIEYIQENNNNIKIKIK